MYRYSKFPSIDFNRIRIMIKNLLLIVVLLAPCTSVQGQEKKDEKDEKEEKKWNVNDPGGPFKEVSFTVSEGGSFQVLGVR